MDNPQKLFLSVIEAAKLLSLSPQSVYDLVERGVLPRVPKEITSRVLIPHNGLEEFVLKATKNS